MYFKSRLLIQQLYKFLHRCQHFQLHILVVAEVDLSGSEIVAGQFKVPVNIVIPGKGLVWAKGDYAVVVVVTANS